MAAEHARRRWGVAAAAMALLLGGCAFGPYAPTATGPPATPSCLPYLSSRASGPAPIWGVTLRADRPIYPGERITLTSTSFGPAADNGWNGATQVDFYLLKDVQNVFWWGRAAGAKRCAARSGSYWGSVHVRDGAFTWSGRVPRSVAGPHLWTVMAVANDGYYYILDIAEGGSDGTANGLARPYRLLAWTGGAVVPKGAGSDMLTIGQPLHLRGSGLAQNGRMLVRLAIRGRYFDSSANLGVAEISAGRVRATLPLPKALAVQDVGLRTLRPDWSYRIELWSMDGKVVRYSLPVTLRAAP